MEKLRSLASNPLARAAGAIVLGAVLFVFTGWVSGQRRLLINWTGFREGEALLFLGAYAQLVLAAAVFFQIRTADRSLDRQVVAFEREQRVEVAEAIVELVASAANSRSLFVHAIPSLRTVTYNHGSADAISGAEAELLDAERLRQAAHAAEIKVQVLLGASDPLLAAASGLTKALDLQRKRARAILAWSKAPQVVPIPDPQGVGVFAEEHERVLVEAASQLLTDRYLLK